MLIPAKKVLVVEDSDTQALALQMQLKSEGLISIRATCAEDALEYLRSEIPDLAIVDHHLPGMEGIDFCRLLRQNPATESLPLLMLTNDPKTDMERQGLESGADDHLHKTADQDILIARVHTLLRKSTLVSPPHAENEPAFDTARILVLSTNPDRRETIGEILDQTGSDIAYAETAKQAVSHASQNSVDCIIIDLALPHADSIEACQRLDRLRIISRLAYSIIALGGEQLKQDTIDTLEAGADDVVPDTTDKKLVTARIRTQLRRTTLQAQKERVQARFRDAELEVLRERTQRQALQAQAKLAVDLHKSNKNLERAYTELKGTQLQLIQSAKMNSLSKLASGLVHEVNNPLTFVFAHMETVLESFDTLKQDFGENLAETGVELLANSQQRLIEARAGLERVSDIVSNLRLFSRIDEGKFQNADIAGCINSALKLNAHSFRSRNVKTDVRYADDNQLRCAPGFLNQVFMNLLSNAIDAAGEGGTIRIRTGRDEGIYWISIADSGPGVPDEIRERIFEPFFTTKDVGAGTGLGLPITYRIVGQHKGTIQLRDADIGGAEFHIRIPTDLEEIDNDDQLR